MGEKMLKAVQEKKAEPRLSWAGPAAARAKDGPGLRNVAISKSAKGLLPVKIEQDDAAGRTGAQAKTENDAPNSTAKTQAQTKAPPLLLLAQLNDAYDYMLAKEKERSLRPGQGNIMKEGDVAYVIFGTRQKTYAVRREEGKIVILHEDVISTGKNGFGNEENSGKTPVGMMQIMQVWGQGEPVGRVFQPHKGDVRTTDQIARIYNEPPKKKKGDDLIVTRVITLMGLEEDNQNVMERGVYFHGTDAEYALGTPASHACLRMGNEAIAQFAAQVRAGDKVLVLPQPLDSKDLALLKGRAGDLTLNKADDERMPAGGLAQADKKSKSGATDKDQNEP